MSAGTDADVAAAPGATAAGRISATSQRPFIMTDRSFRQIANEPAAPTLTCGSAGTTTSVSVVKRANRSMNSSAELQRVTSCINGRSAPTTTRSEPRARQQGSPRRAITAACGTHIRRFEAAVEFDRAAGAIRLHS
jgi:hypothetical protein